MYNNPSLSILLMFGVLLVSNVVAIAQDDDAPAHVFHVQTIEATFPDDGSVAERDSLWRIFFDATVTKNDLIVSQRTLRHGWGDDSNKLVIIREFASWADVDANQGSIGPRIREALPDSVARQAFFQRYNQYFGGHDDELFYEIPGLQK